MKIMYDYRQIQRFYPRGVSRYGISLLRYLMRINDDERCNHTIVLLIEPDLPCDFMEQEKELKVFTVKDLNASGLCFDVFFNTSTTVLGLPSIGSVDYLYPEIILEKCEKIACVLHDFVPLIVQSYIPDEISKINYALQLEAIKRCDYIFTNSEYTSKSGAIYLELLPERFTTIYGPINEKYFTEDIVAGYNPAKKKDIVSILGMCPRKNSDRLVKAWCIAQKAGNVPGDAVLNILSCFSEKKKLHNICRKNNIPISSVNILDYISDNDLISMISKAKASIFPPYLEGLGLPVLESYALGTPCFAADTSSTKELVNSESTFNPFDENAIAEAIMKIYADEDLLRRNLECGQAFLKKINGKDIARKVFTTLMDGI